MGHYCCAFLRFEKKTGSRRIFDAKKGSLAKLELDTEQVHR